MDTLLSTGQILAITIATKVTLIVVISFAIGLILQRIMRKFKHFPDSRFWLRSLGEALYKPILWIVGGYGVLFALVVIFENYELIVSPKVVSQIRDIFLVAAITWLVFYWKQSLETEITKIIMKKGGDNSDLSLTLVIGRLSSIVIFVVSGLIIMSILDINLTALLAFGGIGSLAVGWAGKDVIANFFGGLMIFLNRPYSKGDWIMSPNKNFEGVVEEIGWYMTRIRTFTRRPTYIPNALITDAIIENPGRMYNRQIKKTVGVRYNDVKVVEPIVNSITKMLKEHPEIDQRQHLMVHLLDFGPSSLDINVYTFTKTTNWHKFRDIQQDVMLKISDIITQHGAEIAFPTNTIHLKQ